MVTTFNKNDVISFGKYLFSKERRQLFLDRQEIDTNTPDLEERIKEISLADFENWKEGEKSIPEGVSKNQGYPEALQAIKNGYWAIRKYAYGRFVINKYPSNQLTMTELSCAVRHNYIPSFEDQMAEDWIILRDPYFFERRELQD